MFDVRVAVVAGDGAQPPRPNPCLPRTFPTYHIRLRMWGVSERVLVRKETVYSDEGQGYAIECLMRRWPYTVMKVGVRQQILQTERRNDAQGTGGIIIQPVTYILGWARWTHLLRRGLA